MADTPNGDRVTQKQLYDELGAVEARLGQKLDRAIGEVLATVKPLAEAEVRRDEREKLAVELAKELKRSRAERARLVAGVVLALVGSLVSGAVAFSSHFLK